MIVCVCVNLCFLLNRVNIAEAIELKFGTGVDYSLE